MNTFKDRSDPVHRHKSRSNLLFLLSYLEQGRPASWHQPEVNTCDPFTENIIFFPFTCAHHTAHIYDEELVAVNKALYPSLISGSRFS